mgnify:CR=1 FL=1
MKLEFVLSAVLLATFAALSAGAFCASPVPKRS